MLAFSNTLAPEPPSFPPGAAAMTADLDRRRFLHAGAATAAALTAVHAAGAADKPSEKIALAVVGLHGRGKDLLRGFSAFDDVEIAALCDPDENVVKPAL